MNNHHGYNQQHHNEHHSSEVCSRQKFGPCRRFGPKSPEKEHGHPHHHGNSIEKSHRHRGPHIRCYRPRFHHRMQHKSHSGVGHHGGHSGYGRHFERNHHGPEHNSQEHQHECHRRGRRQSPVPAEIEVHRGHHCRRFRQSPEKQHECRRQRSPTPQKQWPQRRHSFSFGEQSTTNQQQNICHHRKF